MILTPVKSKRHGWKVGRVERMHCLSPKEERGMLTEGVQFESLRETDTADSVT